MRSRQQWRGAVIENGGQVDKTGGCGNGEDCRWLLTCENGVPTVSFVTFAIEAHCDFVNIFDGSTVKSEQQAHISGTTVPDPFTGTGSSMVVQFTSDGNTIMDGFLAVVACQCDNDDDDVNMVVNDAGVASVFSGSALCVTCPAENQACSHTGQEANFEICDACPGGMSGAGGGANCMACPPGTYTAAGSVECGRCAAPYADRDATPSTPCELCPPGTFAAGTSCEPCLVDGQWVREHAGTMRRECTVCPVGSPRVQWPPSAKRASPAPSPPAMVQLVSRARSENTTTMPVRQHLARDAQLADTRTRAAPPNVAHARSKGTTQKRPHHPITAQRSNSRSISAATPRALEMQTCLWPLPCLIPAQSQPAACAKSFAQPSST